MVYWFIFALHKNNERAAYVIRKTFIIIISHVDQGFFFIVLSFSNCLSVQHTNKFLPKSHIVQSLHLFCAYKHTHVNISSSWYTYPSDVQSCCFTHCKLLQMMVIWELCALHKGFWVAKYVLIETSSSFYCNIQYWVMTERTR